MAMRQLVSVCVFVCVSARVSVSASLCVCLRRCVLVLFACVTAFARGSTWYSPQPPERAALVHREGNGWERRRHAVSRRGPGELAGLSCSCSEKATSSYDR